MNVYAIFALVFVGIVVGYFMRSIRQRFSLAVQKVHNANEPSDLSVGEQMYLRSMAVCMLIGAAAIVVGAVLLAQHIGLLQ